MQPVHHHHKAYIDLLVRAQPRLAGLDREHRERSKYYTREQLSFGIINDFTMALDVTTITPCLAHFLRDTQSDIHTKNCNT